MHIKTCEEENIGLSKCSALLLTIFFIFVFLCMWFYELHRYNEANSCTTNKDLFKIKTISGKTIKQTGYGTQFYIYDGEKKFLFYTSPRTGPDKLTEILNNSLEKDSVANFCRSELISLDIEGKRVFTKDLTRKTLYILGISFIVAVPLLYLFFLYGNRKISFKKNNK